MKQRPITKLALLILLGGLTAPFIALADEVTDVQKKYNLEDPMGGATVPQIVSRIIQQVLPVVGALFLIMFIYGGVLWMTAGGSGDKVKKATQTMINAAIGMAIVVLAYSIVNEVIVQLGSIMTGSG